MNERLTLDQVREALPDVEELRPIFDHLVSSSVPDRTRTWSGSGRLGTLGSRLVPDGAVDPAVMRGLAETEAGRLAELYTRTGRALSAIAEGDLGAAAHALLEAASLEEARDHPERAAAFAAAAHRVVRDGRDVRPAAKALRRWARASKAMGRLDEALALYERSWEAEHALSDPRGAAEAAIGAGNVLEAQGRWTEAAAWYRRALAELEPVGEPVTERWHALLNLHIVTRSSGAVEESVPLLEQAVRAAAEVAPEEAEPALENARGQLEMARGAFARAEDHLRRALATALGARARVTIRLNLSEALLAQGRSLDAAEQARAAEREAIGAGLVLKLPEVYRLLGRIASADDPADAFVLFERALEIVRERSLPRLEEALTLQAYAECEARRGDDDAAGQLREKAGALFTELGIARMRRPWADVFGGSTEPEGSIPPEEASADET